jgi:hypothetical protein
VGKEGGTLVPLDIHDVRDTLDKRHSGNLHVNLSVEAYSTGHPGVLYSCLDEEAPDRRGPSLEELHLMLEGPGKRLPVVAGRTLM